MKQINLLISILALSLLLAACIAPVEDRSTADAAHADDALTVFTTYGTVVALNNHEASEAAMAITLGALYNLSGSQAQLDGPSLNGAQLAVDEINRAGGVLGRPLQLAIADGESNPSVIAEKTADLLAAYPDVAAFMGLSDTDMVLAAAPVAAAAERLFLTSGATSPLLPKQMPDYLYLAAFGDNVQAAAAAEWAYDALSARTVAVLYNGSMQYTLGLQTYFADHFAELGGEVVATEGYMPDEESTLDEAVNGLPKADIIFVAAGPEDAPEAVQRLRAAGFTAPIIGGDGFDSAALWQQYADVSDVYFTTHAYLGADNPNRDIRLFRNAYLTYNPDAIPDAFSALGYDTVRLLGHAIEEAQSTAPADILATLANIKEFDGVTGQISFASGSTIPVKSVTILAIEEGGYRYVTEQMPQSVPATSVGTRATQKEENPASEEERPLKIGVLNPTSGQLASFGQDVNTGMMLFLQWTKERIANRPVALFYGDTAGEPERALREAERLVVEEGVDLLIGIVNSEVAPPVARFASERQIPLIVTIAGAAEVTGAQSSPYVFRTAMANGQQERPLAWYLATQMDIQRAATVVWDFPAGMERASAFANTFGVVKDVPVAEDKLSLSATDFTALLDELTENDLEVIYAFLAGPKAATFIQQMRKREEFANTMLVGSGYLTAGILQEIGANALPIVQASEYTSAIHSPEHDSVVNWLLRDAVTLLPTYADKMRAASDVYVMEGFLGMSVVAQALEALAGDASDTESLLRALAAVNFESVSGPFRFDTQGQAVRNLYITEFVVDEEGHLAPHLITVIENVSQEWTP